jgi:queuine tRNA-ribosyltransferase
MSGEMLGPMLVSWHNIAFYQRLLRGLRDAIEQGAAAEYRAQQMTRWRRNGA